MRRLLLKIPTKFLATFIIGLTILLAFVIALSFNYFFQNDHLKENMDSVFVVYQVMGTVYAILITFTLWGVWQTYSEAGNSAQTEAYSLMDLVHVLETSENLNQINIRKVALNYAKNVIETEWENMNGIAITQFALLQQSHPNCASLVKAVQEIKPANEKETVLYDRALILLDNWLDARRTRMLIAKGNSAKSLWSLLFSGAFVLFAFHGLFVASTSEVWSVLLLGFSYIIGLTFYLIFALDCPFSGKLGIDAEPFIFTVRTLEASH